MKTIAMQMFPILANSSNSNARPLASWCPLLNPRQVLFHLKSGVRQYPLHGFLNDISWFSSFHSGRLCVVTINFPFIGASLLSFSIRSLSWEQMMSEAAQRLACHLKAHEMLPWQTKSMKHNLNFVRICKIHAKLRKKSFQSTLTFLVRSLNESWNATNLWQASPREHVRKDQKSGKDTFGTAVFDS